MNKYLILISLVITALVGGYLYGVKVGIQQGYFRMNTYQAFTGEPINEECREVDMYRREAKLNNYIIEFGKHSDTEWPMFPWFYSDFKEISKGMAEGMVQYRESNPRIVDGIIYAPLKDGWRAYYESGEYKRYLQEETQLEFSEEFSIDQAVKSRISEYEEAEYYYKLALKKYNVE